jgi:hypothetical protein
VSHRRRAGALAPRSPEPLDRARAFARFGTLVGRAVTFGFVPFGPTLQAESPESLAGAFADWLTGTGEGG